MRRDYDLKGELCQAKYTPFTLCQRPSLLRSTLIKQALDLSGAHLTEPNALLNEPALNVEIDKHRRLGAL